MSQPLKRSLRSLSAISACLSVQIGDQGHLYSSESSSSSSNGNGASSSGSAIVFVDDTHKAGGGALLVHHGRVQEGDLHVGQMVSSLMAGVFYTCMCIGTAAGNHLSLYRVSRWGLCSPNSHYAPMRRMSAIFINRMPGSTAGTLWLLEVLSVVTFYCEGDC